MWKLKFLIRKIQNYEIKFYIFASVTKAYSFYVLRSRAAHLLNHDNSGSILFL